MYIYLANKNQIKKALHSMTQMQHTTLKQNLRPSVSFRLGQANGVLGGSCSIKGNEWYDATGTRREVGLRQM